MFPFHLSVVVRLAVSQSCTGGESRRETYSNSSRAGRVHRFLFGGANGYGTPSSPFNNLADAVAFATDAATINIDTGSTIETFPAGILKPLTLRNNTQGSGVVRVGNSTRRSPEADSGFISRGHRGPHPGKE